MTFASPMCWSFSPPVFALCNALYTCNTKGVCPPNLHAQLASYIARYATYRLRTHIDCTFIIKSSYSIVIPHIIIP